MYLLTPSKLRKLAPHVADWLDRAASNILWHAYGATSPHALIRQIDALDLEHTFDALVDFLHQCAIRRLGKAASETALLDWSVIEMERCVYGQCDLLVYKGLLVHLLRATVRRGLVTEQEYRSVLHCLDLSPGANAHRSEACQKLCGGLHARLAVVGGLIEPGELDLLLTGLDIDVRQTVVDAIARNDRGEQAADVFAAAVIA